MFLKVTWKYEHKLFDILLIDTSAKTTRDTTVSLHDPGTTMSDTFSAVFTVVHKI